MLMLCDDVMLTDNWSGCWHQCSCWSRRHADVTIPT